MRKVLIVLLILIVTMSILWIFAGRQISEFTDRFTTVEVTSESMHSIAYEGSGEGGMLILNWRRFTLAPTNPHIGSTKENQLAIANAGRVFAFGPLTPADDARLTANVQTGDVASLSWRHSYIFWPIFRNGAPELTCNGYMELNWTKSVGAKLKMIWRSPIHDEQAPLIRVEISDASR